MLGDVFSLIGKVVSATHQLAEDFADLKTTLDHGKRCYTTRKCEKSLFSSFGVGCFRVLRKVRVRKWSNWPQSRVWKMLRTPWSNNQQFCAKIIPQSVRRYPRPRDTAQRVFFVGGSLLETIAPYGNQPEVKKKREMEVKWRVSRCLVAPLQAAAG